MCEPMLSIEGEAAGIGLTDTHLIGAARQSSPGNSTAPVSPRDP
jgi:hypothetical protein